MSLAGIALLASMSLQACGNQSEATTATADTAQVMANVEAITTAETTKSPFQESLEKAGVKTYNSFEELIKGSTQLYATLNQGTDSQNPSYNLVAQVPTSAPEFEVLGNFFANQANQSYEIYGLYAENNVIFVVGSYAGMMSSGLTLVALSAEGRGLDEQTLINIAPHGSISLDQIEGEVMTITTEIIDVEGKEEAQSETQKRKFSFEQRRFVKQ